MNYLKIMFYKLCFKSKNLDVLKWAITNFYYDKGSSNKGVFFINPTDSGNFKLLEKLNNIKGYDVVKSNLMHVCNDDFKGLIQRNLCIRKAMLDEEDFPIRTRGVQYNPIISEELLDWLKSFDIVLGYDKDGYISEEDLQEFFYKIIQAIKSGEISIEEDKINRCKEDGKYKFKDYYNQLLLVLYKVNFLINNEIYNPLSEKYYNYFKAKQREPENAIVEVL